MGLSNQDLHCYLTRDCQWSKKVFAWEDDYVELKLQKPGVISHSYRGGGAFKILYPIVKAESWLKKKLQ